MGSEQPRISVYSLADLKNTTDDALPNYLNSLKFEQSNYYTDVRLALGFTAVLIAAGTFYFDYTLGWEATKKGTLWAVIIYFIVNALLSLWIWLAEQGCIYKGDLKGTKVYIQSRVEKHNPTYYLYVRSQLPDSFGGWHIANIQAPFSRWFDADGHFVAVQFQQWLASEIPAIGSADPAKIVPQASSDSRLRQGDLKTASTALEGELSTPSNAARRRDKTSSRAEGMRKR